MWYDFPNGERELAELINGLPCHQLNTNSSTPMFCACAPIVIVITMVSESQNLCETLNHIQYSKLCCGRIQFLLKNSR